MMADTPDASLLLAVCMVFAAALYTSVGHAGASAYLALMALFGLEPTVMRPTALALNVIVGVFASYRYVRAGYFRWRTLWPVLSGAVPMAFLGGYLQLPGEVYRPLVGVLLLLAAARLLWPKALQASEAWRDPPVPIAVVAGGALGLLAGLTGTGGGIFLSPLLLFLAWSDARTTSGVAAVFILCNSVAGLLGNVASVRALPPDLALYATAVLLGAAVGTTLGIGRLPVPMILKALGLVLAVAGLKLIGLY